MVWILDVLTDGRTLFGIETYSRLEAFSVTKDCGEATALDTNRLAGDLAVATSGLVATTCVDVDGRIIMALPSISLRI